MAARKCRRKPRLSAWVSGWTFGQTLKTYSDLDIALWDVRQTDAKALANLRADLEDSPLPWRVDISNANDLPVALREQVEQHGEWLQGNFRPDPSPP